MLDQRRQCPVRSEKHTHIRDHKHCRTNCLACLRIQLWLSEWLVEAILTSPAVCHLPVCCPCGRGLINGWHLKRIPPFTAAWWLTFFWAFVSHYKVTFPGCNSHTHTLSPTLTLSLSLSLPDIKPFKNNFAWFRSLAALWLPAKKYAHIFTSSRLLITKYAVVEKKRSENSPEPG